LPRGGLLPLRILCNDDRDFANPIERSVHGGAKSQSQFASTGPFPLSRL
jgi:hypothetical protein